jgi:hypothetical protein
VGHSNNAFLRAKRIDQLIARSERSRVATKDDWQIRDEI